MEMNGAGVEKEIFLAGYRLAIDRARALLDSAEESAEDIWSLFAETYEKHLADVIAAALGMPAAEGETDDGPGMSERTK